MDRRVLPSRVERRKLPPTLLDGFRRRKSQPDTLSGGLAPASSRPFQHSCPEILSRIVSRIDYIFSMKRSIGSKGGGGQAYRKAQPSPLKADLRKLPPALPLDVSSGSTRSVVFTRDRVYPSIQPLAKLDDVCLKSLLSPPLSLRSFRRNSDVGFPSRLKILE